MRIPLIIRSATTTPGRTLRRANPLAVALVGVGLFVSACGGPTSSGVASIGSSSTPSTLTGGAGNSGAPPTPKQLQAMTVFAGCVRRHGLPQFPDPPFANGELNKLGFRKSSPQMEAATKACHSDALAAGVVETPEEIQQHLEQMLMIAQCMQANGYPNFPDPNAQGGLAVPSDLNPETSQYAAAAKKCDAPPG